MYNDGYFCKIDVLDNVESDGIENTVQKIKNKISFEDEFEDDRYESEDEEENAKEMQDDLDDIKNIDIEDFGFENDSDKIKYEDTNHEDYLRAEAFDKEWCEFQEKLTTPYEKKILKLMKICAMKDNK